jgi:NAD+ kinase
VNRIGFAYNPTTPPASDLLARGLEWCKAHGVDAWGSEAADRERLLEQLATTDVLLVLGGDGTFLRAASAVAQVDVPILGVNVGKVGFLSKVEPDALESVLAMLVDGRFTLEQRMVIEARIVRAAGSAGAEGAITGPNEELHVALNDAAIVRGALARVVRLELSVDETHVGTYICDGIVVSSPTGSTGYAYSAGGPILDPTARNLIVTPIAAYLAAIRSIVVSPRHTVTVRVIDAHDCEVSIDGQEDIPLARGDAVQVRARERPIRVVEPEGALPFWDLLRRKAQLLPS